MTDLDRIPLTVTWISVEHSPPPLFERVLLYARGDFVFIGHRATASGRWHDDDNEWTTGVTHWMPLPVAPENVVLEDAR